MPLVSVIIPTYNRASLVIRAIRSVLKQTFQDFEIMVVDDNSTDRTEEAVKGIDDNRIRYAKHRENKGPATARNTGLRMATGNYVAFLDSDDEWLAPKLEEQLKLFRNGKDALGVVHTGVAIVHESTGKVMETWIPRHRGHVFEKCLVSMCVSSGASTAMVKREALDRVRGFDETLKSCEDWDLWIRIAKYYEFDFLPQILAKCYVHPQRLNSDFKALALCYKRALQKHRLEIERQPRTIKAEHYFYLGNHFCYYGDTSLAKECISKAFRTCPFNPKYLLSFLFFLLFGAKIYTKLSYFSKPLRHRFCKDADIRYY